MKVHANSLGIAFMSRRTWYRTVSTSLLAAASLALTACATGSPGATNANVPTDSFPVTIDHAFGQTVISEVPQRVASVAWGNQDVALALGIIPVGMAGGAWGDDNGDGILPWTFDALNGLGATGASLPVLFDEVDGINFEAVASVNPDVVLAAYSGLSAEDFQTLSAITPHVVAYPGLAWGTNWREMALINGAALGKRSAAEALVAKVDATIAEAKSRYPDVAGKTVAYTYLNPSDLSSISVYTPIDARVQFTQDLGLGLSPRLKDIIGDSQEFFATIAAENADSIDADILVTYGDDSTLALLQAHPLIGKIPAVQRGSVVILPNATPLAAATSGPTVLSIPWALDRYLGLFQAAAIQVK
ncbi:MAG TPA: iron-siderophore ABC transporter substrate-binding protein [Microbacteriaceae bacterium]|nr:iron-siderophore ABC transporter substrate-binding protein [Microbacteriaceae bacterium]